MPFMLQTNPGICANEQKMRYSATVAKFRDIKVVVRSPDGHYLTGGPTEWGFTDNLADAAVFSYLAHGIEAQLEQIRRSQGFALEAVHVASHDLCESCDRCKEIVLPSIVFFDGKQFLCPDCRAKSPAASNA